MIHKIPEVGKFICTEMMYYYGMFGKGGIITSIKGKRIYFKRLRLDFNDKTYCTVLKDEN